MNTPMYYEIVFLQGDEARETLAILDNEGENAAISHLAQWDFGGKSEHSPTGKPWGTSDHVVRDGDYFLSYNLRLGYIGLCRRVTCEFSILSNHEHA